MTARRTSAPGLPTCLYPREEEIAKLVLGPRSAMWAGLAQVLERKGLPPVDPIFGGRYWPAVKEYLDRRNRLDAAGPLKPDGEENWNVGRNKAGAARARV